MQSYDEKQKMLEAKTSENGEPLLAALSKLMQKPEVAEVVIGKLPAKGQEVKINGLVFLVKFVDHKRGTLQLRIKKFEGDVE